MMKDKGLDTDGMKINIKNNFSNIKMILYLKLWKICMEPEYPLTSLPTMAATRKLTKKNRCISSTCLVPVRHQVFGKKTSNTYDDYDSDSDIQNMIIDNDDHDHHYGVEHHAHDVIMILIMILNIIHVQQQILQIISKLIQIKFKILI